MGKKIVLIHFGMLTFSTLDSSLDTQNLSIWKENLTEGFIWQTFPNQKIDDLKRCRCCGQFFLPCNDCDGNAS